jgi:Domain of unknown function (DUF5666)
MIRRYTAAILLTGAIASGGAITALARSGGVSVPTAAATSQSATAGLLSANMGSGHGRGGPGMGVFGGPGIGGFGGFTVTAISGDTITATGHNNQTVTILVSSTTTYSEAGATAALSDIHVGSTIAVKRAASSTSTTTITATSVTIVLPSSGGVVSAVNGNTITVTGRDSAAHTIVVSSTTRYQKAGQTASLADITTGTSIRAEGTLSGTTLNAQLVTIDVPRLDGQVTAVNGASYTIKGRNGTTYTVNATSSTTYLNADGTTATATIVKVGVNVNAEGTLSSDGKTLTALRVSVEPAGAGRGGPRGGGPGYGPGNGPASIAGTSTGGTITQ